MGSPSSTNAGPNSIGNRLSKSSKLQLHLDPLSAKGEATNPETSHTVTKMIKPVKVVSHFLRKF